MRLLPESVGNAAERREYGRGRQGPQRTLWSTVLARLSAVTSPAKMIHKERPQNASIAQSSLRSDCLFCSRDRPELNDVLLENDTCYARRDNFPVAAGHVEVVPKRHVESFFDLSAEEITDAYSLLVTVQEKLSADYCPDGYTIGVNEGRAAGRTIDHLHIHLIPRNFGDVKDPRGGVRQVVPSSEYTPDDWEVSEGSETN